MSKITAFDRQNLKQVRTDIVRALMEVEMKYGIRIELGNGKFNDDQVTFKVEANVTDRGGRAPGQTVRGDKQAEELKHVAKVMYPKLDLTKILSIGGAKYNVVGYNQRAHAYPFILQQVGTDKKFKFAREQVLLAAGLM